MGTMDATDLYRLRDSFSREGILLCFNGPISRSIIEEIGEALKNYLKAERTQPSAAMDIFGAYIEMSQNIRHYTTRQNYDDRDASAIVVVGREPDGAYRVSAGNLVEIADGMALVERIRQLALLDKAALKAAYKEQLRAPRPASSPCGAGLGLLDIARKARTPLSATLIQVAEGRAFFSLCAVI